MEDYKDKIRNALIQSSDGKFNVPKEKFDSAMASDAEYRAKIYNALKEVSGGKFNAPKEAFDSAFTTPSSSSIPTVTVKGDSVYNDKGVAVGESPKPIEFPAKELKAFSEGLMKLPANILNKPENRNIYYNTFSQKRNLNPNLVKQVGEKVVVKNQILKWQDYLRQNPNDVKAYDQLAKLHESIGENEEANQIKQATNGIELPSVGSGAWEQQPMARFQESTQGFSGKNGFTISEKVETTQEKPLLSNVTLDKERSAMANQVAADTQFSNMGLTAIPNNTPTVESSKLEDIYNATKMSSIVLPLMEKYNKYVGDPASDMIIEGTKQAGEGAKLITKGSPISGALKSVVGLGTALIGVVGGASPLPFAAFTGSMEHIPGAEKVAMPFSYIKHQFEETNGDVPDWMNDATAVADFIWMAVAAHKIGKVKTEYDLNKELKKHIESLTPEEIRMYDDAIKEKRIELGEEGYKKYVESKLTQDVSKLSEATKEIEATDNGMQEYNPPPTPNSLRTLEPNAEVMFKGEVGKIEQGDVGDWYFVNGDGKSTQLKVADKFNPTESLAELDIQVLPDVPESVIAKAVADGEHVGTVKYNGEEYFVSLEGNPNDLGGDLVFKVMADGSHKNIFDNHVNEKFGQDRKLAIANKFLNEKGLPNRTELKPPRKTQENAVQKSSTTEEIPSATKGGKNITESSEGVRPIEQGQEAPKEVVKEEVITESPTIKTIKNEKENGVQEGRKDGNENVTEGLQSEGEKRGQKVNKQEEGELLTPSEEVVVSEPQPQKPIVAENEVSASKETREPIKVEKTTEGATEGVKTEIQSALDEFKAAREARKSVGKNLGIKGDALTEAQAREIAALIKLAKEYIKQGIQTAADMASELKEPLTKEMFDAYNMAKKNIELTDDILKKILPNFGKEISSGRKNALNTIDKKYAEGLTNEERLEAAKEVFKSDPIKFEERNDALTNEVLETDLSDLKVSLNQQVEYLVHIRNIDNKIFALENDAAAAYKKGENKKAADIEQTINYYKEKREEINAAALKIGSLSGTSLQFLRTIIDRNFNVVADKRFLESKTGARLSPEQEKQFEEIKKRADDLTNEILDLREKLLKNEKQDAINAIKNDLEPKKTNKQGIKEEFKDKIAARKARKKELIDGLRKDYFQVLNDFTSVGKMFVDKRLVELCKLVLEDAADYASFSAEMVKEFGKDIKDSLPKLYKEAGGKEEAVLPSINAKNELEISEQTLRNLVAEGFDTPEKLTEKLYDLISPDLPTVTKEQIEVAYSRYGKETKENKDTIGKKLREIKQTKKLMLALDDLLKGNLPKRSGMRREPLTPEQRKLLQEVRARTKDLPLSVEESNKLYASALDTAKRRMQNRIDDLRDQIDTKTKRLRAKNVLELDADGKELEAKLKEVQQEFNDTFGKNELTNEQKVDRVLKSLEESIKKEEEFNSNPTWSSELPKEPTTSAEIEIRRKKLADLKEEYAKLKESSGLAQAEREIAKAKSLESAVKKQEELLSSGAFTSKVKGQEVTSAEIKAEQAKLKDLKEKLRQSKESSGLAQAEREIAKAKSLESRIEEAEKTLAEGGQSSKIKVEAPTSDAIKASKMYLDWLKEAQAELDNASGLAQANAEVAKIKLLDRQIKKYQERTKSRDFTPRVKKELNYAEDIAIKERQLEEEKFNYLVEKEKFLIENQPDYVKVRSFMYDILNTARAIMASYDLSAGGRQGAYYLPAYPKTFLKAYQGMLRDIRSDAAHNDYKYNLKSSPYYKLMKESGLFIADTHPAMKAKEEMYTGHIFNRVEDLRKTAEAKNWKGVPDEVKLLLKANQKVAAGINASERAYVGFLNRLRTQIFQQNVKLIQSGIRFDANLFGKKVGMQLTKPSFAKENFKILADIINQGTGRGSITKSAEPLMQVLNWGAFSARFTVSRFTTILKTLAHAANPYNKISATTRAILMKDLTTFVATNTALLYLVKQMFKDDKNVSVGTNPYDSDTYGTINVNGTNYGLWGGMNKSYAFAAQLAMHRKDFGSVRNYDANRLDLAGNYFGNKLAPIPGLAYHMAKGKNYKGEDFELSKELPNILMPMTLSQALQSKNTSELMALNSAVNILGVQADERLADPAYTAKRVGKESSDVNRVLMMSDASGKFTDKEMLDLMDNLAIEGGLLGDEDFDKLRVKFKQDGKSTSVINKWEERYNNKVSEEEGDIANLKKRAEKLDEFFDIYKSDKKEALTEIGGVLKNIEVEEFNDIDMDNDEDEKEVVDAIKRAFPNISKQELAKKYNTLVNDYKVHTFQKK